MCVCTTHNTTGTALRPGSDHVGYSWSSHVCVLKRARFASVKSFLGTPPELQTKLKHALKIPDLFLDRMYLQSNGFSGYEVSLDQDQRVESYSGFIYRVTESGQGLLTST